jgi:hypothetical protein
MWPRQRSHGSHGYGRPNTIATCAWDGTASHHTTPSLPPPPNSFPNVTKTKRKFLSPSPPLNESRPHFQRAWGLVRKSGVRWLTGR